MDKFEWNFRKIAEDPTLTNDFKWNFAREALKPKMEITGPSVGSLLFAINPETSELGLKQMNDELTQQVALNEKFDKQTKEAIDFMENRVKEDIDAKTFNEKMKLEAIKAGNVDAGHANSLLSNYTQAVQSGDATSIAMAEDRIRKVFPNAEEILQQAKEQVKLGKVQEDKYREFGSRFPVMWETPGERTKFIKEVEDAMKSRLITSKQGYELIGKANGINDEISYKKLEGFKAGVINAVNKNITTSNAQDKKTLITNYAKENGLDLSRPNDRAQAEDWYKINYGGK